ncbi:threonine aldolase family protein [Haloarchaeobius sp. DFWS5]|uniref:threonine aldolase family protein n=1 Tax=Haloarchaeobius sp. DFWS5 TaxID=3446114 RepID=UPI003EBA643A
MLDLRSDTVTKPDEAMREAAMNATVGDDVYGEDPTVNELEAEAADLVGKEAALYVPSGTMGNQIAVRTHTERGQEVLTERESHVVKWELGGMAQLSTLQVRTLDGGERGIPTPAQIHEGYVAEDLHRPGTGLLTLENTHNSKGGIAIAPEDIAAAAEAAHEHDVPVHLDGARVCNAAVAHDVPVAEMTEAVDSVMFCLSKGLGAPVGSILAGPEEFIQRARRTRKLFGGGMRQAGIIAAPGLEALSNVERLADDHANAKTLAAELDGVSGLRVPEPETNIVLVHTAESGLDADGLLAACEDVDVLGSKFGEQIVRFCTHWNVDEDDVVSVADRVESAL